MTEQKEEAVLTAESGTAISALVAARAITPNEGRAMLGLDPLLGGDSFICKDVAVAKLELTDGACVVVKCATPQITAAERRALSFSFNRALDKMGISGSVLIIPAGFEIAVLNNAVAATEEGPTE